MSVIRYKYEVKIVRYIVQLVCYIQVLAREILIDYMMSMISYHDDLWSLFDAIEPYDTTHDSIDRPLTAETISEIPAFA